MKKLQYGMVGGGPGSFIGDAHRRSINIDGQAQLVAGCFSRSPEKCRQTGEELGIAPERCYASFEEMAKEEAGLIIRIDSQMNSQSSGFVTTHNRKLVRSLDQLIRTDDGVSLVDAIRISIQEMKEVYRGNKEVFQDFAGRLLRENERQTVCEGNGEKGKCFYYNFPKPVVLYFESPLL